MRLICAKSLFNVFFYRKSIALLAPLSFYSFAEVIVGDVDFCDVSLGKNGSKSLTCIGTQQIALINFQDVEAIFNGLEIAGQCKI